LLSIRERLLGAILVRGNVERSRDPDLADTTVASGTVKKVIEINPYLLGTMAGGAGGFFFSFILDVSSAGLTSCCFG